MASTLTGSGQAGRDPKAVRMLWVTFAWGSCFVAISIGLRDAPLLWLAALRALIAGAVLAIAAGLLRRPLPSGRRTWGFVALLGLVNVAVAFAAMFGGILGLSTGAASVLANAQPLLILLPAWWLFHERPSRRTVVAMLVGFAGLLLVAIPNGAGAGAWLALASAGAVTAGTLLARAVGGDPPVVAAAQFLLGGLVLLAAAVLVEGPPAISWTPGFTGALLYLSVVGTAATYLAWFAEVRHARLDRLTAWTLLVPVFGIVLSTLILGESQTGWAWLGMAVVVAALAALSLPLGRRAGAPPAAQFPSPSDHRADEGAARP